MGSSFYPYHICSYYVIVKTFQSCIKVVISEREMHRDLLRSAETKTSSMINTRNAHLSIRHEVSLSPEVILYRSASSSENVKYGRSE